MSSQIPSSVPECAANMLMRSQWFPDPSIIKRARLAPATWFARLLSSRILSGTEIAAITLGRTIYYRQDIFYNPHTADGLSLLAHEIKHIEQFERYGLWKFYWNYLKAYFKGGYGESVPQEAEAYELGRKVWTHVTEEFIANSWRSCCREQAEPHNPSEDFVKRIPDAFNFEPKPA